ncbi:PD-(D/E)XK nuclease family protein [uncultured Brachyspira sp.]|uniref:PD-(D/E)XK nuclease family protein n=1 Tax=uncultured Brachyspira sp. TaxID=221953 RepID=UPI0027DC2D24|nr:PD-(D/E)XK nuclease family protein [uncultured Brachyspira sp.]
MNDKIFTPNPKDLIKVIDNLYSSMNNYNIEVINLISNLEKENIKRYEDILEKQGDRLKFNIFDIITDKWKRENLHSEILKFLLENYEVFFNNFLELINIKDKKEYLNAEITNEEARIDILIKSEKKAIIVENKINWAPDQNEQLARYYKKVKEKKEVEKIVYIAPSKDKNPDAQTFGEYEKEIKDRLEKIISFYGSENDLVSCFEKSRDKLKENLENTKNNFDSENFNRLFFINHYIEILKRTGAGDMSEVELNFFKEIMEKYKTDKDIFKKINYIGEMYNNLLEIKNKYILENIKAEDWGYNKEGHYYSCAYTFSYGKNNFYLEIYTYDIFKIRICVYDDKGKKNDIKNILSKALNEEDIDKIIGDRLELDFPD